MANLEIPDDLLADFMHFLDSSQSLLTDVEVTAMTPDEQRVIEFIDRMLGDARTLRHKDESTFISSVQEQFNISVEGIRNDIQEDQKSEETEEDAPSQEG